LLFPVLLLAAGQFLGCGFKKVATQASADIFYDATPAIDSESDVDLARDASLSFLKMLDGFYLQDPKNPRVLLLLTRSYAGFAYGFTENDILAAKGNDPAAYEKANTRAKLFYTRARKYALELLSLNGAFADAQEGSLEDFQKALQTFSKKDIERLFWAGFAWGNYLNFNKDSIEAVAEMPRIEAVMNRVLELDENYYYGGPHLFLGAFYAGRPKALGGDPERAKASFDKAIAVSDGKYLMARVVKAQYYAVQIQDLALYRSLLQEVIAADPAALPEQRLSNELAVIRAKTLSAKPSLFFAQSASKKKK
jgi:hypothetical protein